MVSLKEILERLIYVIEGKRLHSEMQELMIRSQYSFWDLGLDDKFLWQKDHIQHYTRMEVLNIA